MQRRDDATFKTINIKICLKTFVAPLRRRVKQDIWGSGLFETGILLQSSNFWLIFPNPLWQIVF